MRDGTIYFTDGDSAEIRVFTATGDLERIIRVPALEREVTDDEFDEVVRELDAQTNSDLALRYQPVANPGVLPVFTDLLVDDEGRIWAKRFQVDPDAQPCWLVFDREGRLTAQVDVPRFDLHAVSGGALLGVARYEMDIEHVVRYPFHQPGS